MWEKIVKSIVIKNNKIINLTLEEISIKIVEENSLVTFLNPYSVKKLNREIELLENFDYIFLDGIALVYYFLLVKKIKIKRISFDMGSLAPYVFSYACRNNKSIFLVGSKPHEISVAANKIKKRFPNLNIIGYSSGFFKDEKEEAKIISQIREANPDIVVVGMGAYLQEKFLIKLRNSNWNGCGITCGAFLEQTSTKINYYPSLVNKLNLRWLYRLFKNPKLIKRYFFDYPIQIIKIIRRW